MVETMFDPARIAKLLVDKITERQNTDRRRLRTNPHEEEVADYLLNIIDDISSCVSYEVEFYDARDSAGRKRHTWKSTKHRFGTVPHQQYITRFRHYIEQQGTKRAKLQIIDDFVYDKFEEARERVLPVHDHDLRRWALQKAAEDSVLNFQASEH